MKALRVLAAISLAFFMIYTVIQPVSGGAMNLSDYEDYNVKVEPIHNGLKLANSEIGIIHGGENDTKPPAVYISGERLRGISEFRDGRRVIGREYITSNEKFVFSIFRIIEYRDINNNSNFDGTSDGYEYHLLGTDIPVGGISLNTSWRTSESYTVGEEEAQLTYIASKRSPIQDLKWNQYTGRMEEYRGDVKAGSVKICMNISLSHAPSKQVLNGVEIGGSSAQLSAKISCEITRWKYEYSDSRLMIQSFLQIYNNSYLVNISTANPHYMDINGSTEILFPKPIYGHIEKISDGQAFIGALNGKRECFDNGINTTYRDNIMGAKEFSSLETKGFYVIRGIMCGPSNASFQTMYFNITQFVPDPIERTDATPTWMVGIEMAEAGTIALAAVTLSYHRYRKR